VLPSVRSPASSFISVSRQSQSNLAAEAAVPRAFVVRLRLRAAPLHTDSAPTLVGIRSARVLKATELNVARQPRPL